MQGSSAQNMPLTPTIKLGGRPQTQSKHDSKSVVNVNNFAAKDISNLKSRGISGVQINKFNEIVKESKNLPGYIANYLKSPVFDKNLELQKFKNS